MCRISRSKNTVSNIIQIISLNFQGVSSLPPEEIISSHNVEQPVHVLCNLLCFNASKCVGFNFRSSTKAINCQLTNTTKNRKVKEEGGWKLFLDIGAVRTLEI